MSVDTEIEGSPTSIEGAATWLKGSLAPKIGDAADAASDVRRDAQGSWRCEAGDELAGLMNTARDSTDGLETAVTDMATDLEEFAEKLRTCQSDMASVREEARAAKLEVNGFVVVDPGPGPERPPDDFTGTDAEVAAHDQRVEAYNDHQDLIRAYNAAASEADRVDRVYNTACEKLQDVYTPTQHASWIVSVADIIGDGAAASLAAQLAARQGPLLTRAQELLDEAQTALDDIRANPDRYMERRFFFFHRLNEARLAADVAAVEGRISDAENLLRQSDDLAAEARAAGAGRVVRGLGRVLGPLGVGLGVYNDYQEGESTEQIIVSQGGSLVAGIAAGAAIGTMIPVPVVGTVVGGIVGAGVSLFADGAIDSLFENGPDVGAALEEGWNAIEDTGSAIADGVSGAMDTVGGWFS
ncbi:hypothetical protein [Aeromicrobium sp.]|uniref:hypothetical protein n=1 Tax=Aeromicrobium sp. TaxID=1871063 RepID=UPI003511CB40